jgi:hypothetical protein
MYDIFVHTHTHTHTHPHKVHEGNRLWFNRVPGVTVTWIIDPGRDRDMDHLLVAARR